MVLGALEHSAYSNYLTATQATSQEDGATRLRNSDAEGGWVPPYNHILCVICE